MDKEAIYKLTYGLFVLTAKENEKDNGCIINTAIQVTSEPNRISVAVNKANYTHDMIMRTGKFNVSVLSESSQFDTYKHFGFQSGKDVDKFAGEIPISFERASNDIVYITSGTNAYISAEVYQTVDLGTHTLFIADVKDMKLLDKTESTTYSYYQSNIKPKPQAAKQPKKGYICTVCGYIYEGDVLPDDFICPICKHPASDFKKL